MKNKFISSESNYSCKHLTLLVTKDNQIKAIYTYSLGNRCFGYLATNLSEIRKICKLGRPHIVLVDQDLPNKGGEIND